VAVETQFAGSGKKQFRLRGLVAGVTGRTPLFRDRRMRYFHVKADFVVAFTAQVVSGTGEQNTVFRGVGIVTGVAFAIFEWHVQGLILIGFGGGVVAIGTQIRIGVRDLERVIRVGRSVAIVAGHADSDVGAFP